MAQRGRKSVAGWGRSLLTTPFASIVLLALSLLIASPADAATRYAHVGSFGSLADFNPPQRMAVHQASGKLFVVDRGGNRIRVIPPRSPRTRH